MAMSLVEIISAKKNFTSHVINEVSKTRIVATETLNYSLATQRRAEMTYFPSVNIPIFIILQVSFFP